jgi:hypothetical protein
MTFAMANVFGAHLSSVERPSTIEEIYRRNWTAPYCFCNVRDSNYYYGISSGKLLAPREMSHVGHKTSSKSVGRISGIPGKSGRSFKLELLGETSDCGSANCLPYFAVPFPYLRLARLMRSH